MTKQKLDSDAEQVQRAYPEIYFACHVAHTRRRSTPLDLSAQDCVYLGHLDLQEPISPHLLARHLGIADSTLSAFLKRMQDRGYIERRLSSRSRREAELRLTAQGVDAVRATSIIDFERIRTVLARLTPGHRARAVKGIRILAEACRAAREEFEASHEKKPGWTRARWMEMG